MTKTSPLIPHDILPASTKNPLCWFQRTQLEEMVNTAQKGVVIHTQVVIHTHSYSYIKKNAVNILEIVKV